MLKKVIAITGPTASGKSDFAYKLACALNGEVVMCDTLQMYRNFPVGANHPPKKFTQKVRYHNLAELDCFSSRPNAHQVADKVRLYCREIAERGKIPIIEGGSVFHLNIICRNDTCVQDKELSPYKEKAKQAMSEQIQLESAIDKDEEWSELLKKLEAKLSLAAGSLASINKNDKYRLEKKLTYELREQSAGRSVQKDAPSLEQRLDVRTFVLHPEQELAERINRRSFLTLNEEYFREIGDFWRRLQQTSVNIRDMALPVGTEEALQLLVYAQCSDSDSNTGRKIEHFVDVFQGYNRSYSTRQRKYLRKYFRDAVWMPATFDTNTRQKVLSYFECSRDEYLQRVRSQEDPKILDSSTNKKLKKTPGCTPSQRQVAALLRMLKQQAGKQQ